MTGSEKNARPHNFKVEDTWPIMFYACMQCTVENIQEAFKHWAIVFALVKFMQACI